MAIRYVVGIDEVGRGPLAGPVTVCAACIKGSTLRIPEGRTLGSKDSKALSVRQREAKLQEFKQMRARGLLDWRIASVSHKVIDRNGIMYALHLAISRCLSRLYASLGVRDSKLQIMLDGGLKVPAKYKNQKTIIRGDVKVPIIAAASIIAKVHRDRKMIRLGVRHPSWRFDKHKGYGTKLHYARIKKHGLSPLHRQSFL